MAESMNIAVNVAAAESLFSNRLAERQPHHSWHDEQSIRGITMRHKIHIQRQFLLQENE